MNDLELPSCIHCRQPIAGDARVCMHCRKSALVDLTLEQATLDAKLRYKTARALNAAHPGLSISAVQTALASRGARLASALLPGAAAACAQALRELGVAFQSVPSRGEVEAGAARDETDGGSMAGTLVWAVGGTLAAIAAYVLWARPAPPPAPAVAAPMEPMAPPTAAPRRYEEAAVTEAPRPAARAGAALSPPTSAFLWETSVDPYQFTVVYPAPSWPPSLDVVVSLIPGPQASGGTDCTITGVVQNWEAVDVDALKKAPHWNAAGRLGRLLAGDTGLYIGKFEFRFETNCPEGALKALGSQFELAGADRDWARVPVYNHPDKLPIRR